MSEILTALGPAITFLAVLVPVVLWQGANLRRETALTTGAMDKRTDALAAAVDKAIDRQTAALTEVRADLDKAIDRQTAALTAVRADLDKAVGRQTAALTAVRSEVADLRRDLNAGSTK